MGQLQASGTGRLLRISCLCRIEREYYGAPRNTFLGIETCDLSLSLPQSDVMIFGAANATPHVKGRTSHAANGPKAIRRFRGAF